MLTTNVIQKWKELSLDKIYFPFEVLIHTLKMSHLIGKLINGLLLSQLLGMFFPHNFVKVVSKKDDMVVHPAVPLFSFKVPPINLNVITIPSLAHNAIWHLRDWWLCIRDIHPCRTFYLALVLFITVGSVAGRGYRTAGTTGTIEGFTDMGVTDMGVTSGTSSMDGNNRDNEDTEGKECCCTLLFKCQFKCCNTMLGVQFGSTSIDL